MLDMISQSRLNFWLCHKQMCDPGQSLNLFKFSFKSTVSVSHSVLSDSLQPHGLQLARFICTSNSAGKNTGVVCQSLLQRILKFQFKYRSSFPTGKLPAPPGPSSEQSQHLVCKPHLKYSTPPTSAFWWLSYVLIFYFLALIISSQFLQGVNPSYLLHSVNEQFLYVPYLLGHYKSAS